MRFWLGWKLDILIFPTIHVKPANSYGQERITRLKLGLKSTNKVQEQEKKKNIISLRVMDFIHYKESLMLLRTYMASFGILVLQEFHIKQKELND